MMGNAWGKVLSGQSSSSFSACICSEKHVCKRIMKTDKSNLQNLGGVRGAFLKAFTAQLISVSGNCNKTPTTRG